MTLRLRDIVKVGVPPSAPRIAVPVEAVQPSLSLLRGAVTRAPETSYALYAALLASFQACLEQAQARHPVTLGPIPRLIEQAVKNLSAGDPELVRLSTLDEHNVSLAAHGVNVAVLSIQVGLERGLYEPQLLEVGLAGLLHDIGMVRVTPLMETPVTLEKSQRLPIEDHPRWSHEALAQTPELSDEVRAAILQEHERYDGSGYPKRLAGASIHPYAQLIGLLDVYESLIHHRPHRKRLVPSEAMRLIVRDMRRAFHPDLLRAFLEVIPPFPLGSWVQLTTGELAKVVATSRHAPLAPTVEILVGPQGGLRARPDTVDLAADRRLQILKAVPEPLE